MIQFQTMCGDGLTSLMGLEQQTQEPNIRGPHDEASVGNLEFYSSRSELIRNSYIYKIYILIEYILTEYEVCYHCSGCQTTLIRIELAKLVGTHSRLAAQRSRYFYRGKFDLNRLLRLID